MHIAPFPRWLMDNWLISSGESVGKPYSFRRHSHLWDIANDEHEHIVVEKSAQCGISELEVGHMLFLVDTRLGNALYIFPAGEQMRDFVDGRVKTAITGNQYLEARCHGNFSAKQIHWALDEHDPLRRVIYFRGSNKMNQIISVDASLLKVDEVDQCDPTNLAALEKRLGASSTPNQHWFSTPTYPMTGINAMYLESDQRKWHVKCEHCGEWQWLDWDRNVEFEHHPAEEDPAEIITGERVFCHRCMKDLDRLSPGEWVAAYPKRDVHGYHISKLFSPMTTLRKLCLNSTRIDYGSVLNFWNQDLGLPYLASEAKLTRDDLDGCVMEYEMPKSWRKPSYMGVDVGPVALYVIIGSEVTLPLGPEAEETFHGIVYANTVPNFEDLDRLVKQFNVESCVIDAQPETRKAKEFANRHSRRVRVCYYEGDRHGKEKAIWRPGNDGLTILAQRTLAMSNLYAQMARARVALPRNAASIPDLYDQLCAPQLVYREDQSTGEKRASYPKTMKPDHYYHAFLYEMLSRRMLPAQVRVHQREWH